MAIKIYNEQDFQELQKVGKLTAQAREYLKNILQPGMTTNDIDQHFVEFLQKHGGNAPCLGYHGFPKHLCVSINEEICHGIPSNRIIKEDDVVSIDLVVELNGYYGDTCTTIALGQQPEHITTLVEITNNALMHAIHSLKPNMLFKQIGKLIEDYIKPHKFDIVREYCGHGIGKTLHEDPQILHYYNPLYPNIIIKPGMCFTIEPMIVAGKQNNITLADEWTVVTTDKSISVQFEHTVFMTNNGPIILTQ